MPLHLITTFIFEFLDALDTQIAKSVENRFCKLSAINFVRGRLYIYKFDMGFDIFAMLADKNLAKFDPKIKQIMAYSQHSLTQISGSLPVEREQLLLTIVGIPLTFSLLNQLTLLSNKDLCRQSDVEEIYNIQEDDIGKCEINIQTCSLLVLIAASCSCKVRTLLSAPASSVCKVATLAFPLLVPAFANSLRNLST